MLKDYDWGNIAQPWIFFVPGCSSVYGFISLKVKTLGFNNYVNSLVLNLRWKRTWVSNKSRSHNLLHMFIDGIGVGLMRVEIKRLRCQFSRHQYSIKRNVYSPQEIVKVLLCGLVHSRFLRDCGRVACERWRISGCHWFRRNQWPPEIRLRSQASGREDWIPGWITALGVS